MNINNVKIVDASSKLETVDSASADYLLGNFTFRLQRPLDRRNYDQMHRTMARGEFPITHGILCTSLDTNRTDILDMFHRLSVVRDNGHTIRINIQRMVVQTEQDKEALWMYIDGGGRNRTPSDYRALLNSQIEGLTAYAKSALERASGAIAFRFSEQYLVGYRGFKIPAGQRVEVIEKYAPHAKDFFSATKRASPAIKSPLSGGFAVALGSVLIETQKEIAVPFFQSISANDGLAKGDPRWLFFDTLSQPAPFRDTLRTMQRLAYCWNSHYGRESRQTFSRLGEGVAVPLAGTAYVIGER